MYPNFTTTALAAERVNTLLAEAETHRRVKLARQHKAWRSARARAHESPTRAPSRVASVTS
jgi:hypothetical protein